ncbi:MAG: dephospho-CoA kinase [Oscillospiraceae bacterium]|nr:dephospho-CoA kinase [Oscillospiraceae bacterium]
MKIITLTGPAASGKSHVAEVFSGICEARGVSLYHIDTDKIVHELYASDTILAIEIASVFGIEVLHFTMGIDRKALGDEVFGNPAKLAQLGSIVHPRVMAACREICEKQRREGQTQLVLCQIPQLHQVGRFGDVVVAVQAGTETRKARLVNRGVSEERAEVILASQPTDGEYAKLADHIIYNRPEDRLQEQVERILKGVLS